MIDFASVVQDAQRGDAAAFDALVDEYSHRLYGFLYRLTGRAHDAEDLVQEVFVRVVRTIRTYEHRDRFDAWIFRIAANLARDRGRRARRAPELTSLDAVRLGGDEDDGGGWSRVGDPDCPNPEDRMDLAEDADRMQEALVALPAAEREVLMLRHYAQISFSEIAELMETPLGTALARAHRGLRKLRTLMESDS